MYLYTNILCCLRRSCCVLDYSVVLWNIPLSWNLLPLGIFYCLLEYSLEINLAVFGIAMHCLEVMYDSYIGNVGIPLIEVAGALLFFFMVLSAVWSAVFFIRQSLCKSWPILCMNI